MFVSSWIRRRILWKGYESKSTLEMNVHEIFSDFQCWYDNCSLVAESGVNFFHCIRYWTLESKNNFLQYFIERLKCILCSLVCIFSFSFVLVCLLVCSFFCFLYLFMFFVLFFLFFYLPWMFDALPWKNKSSSYVCLMVKIVTARRAQKW